MAFIASNHRIVAKGLVRESLEVQNCLIPKYCHGRM